MSDRATMTQLAAQHGGDWAQLNDATAHEVASRVTAGADGKLALGGVIGGSSGVVAATAPIETQSFAVRVDAATGAVWRYEEVNLGGDNGTGLQQVSFTPPADAIIDTQQFSGSEGEITTQSTYRPGAQTLAREAERQAAVADLNARGLMQVTPNAAAGGSLSLGADGVFRSPGAIQWDGRYGLVTTQAQPTSVAPRYLDAAQAAKFDKLAAQYAVSPGSSWEQLQPQVLTRVLDTASVGADGKLDISRAFGGRTGYVPMTPDPYAKSFQVFTNTETGALYRLDVVPGGGGEGGDSVVPQSFTMPEGGRIVTETVDLGGDNGTSTRQIYVPSEAYAARAAALQGTADAMNAAGMVQVQANGNGRWLAINDSGGYRDASKIGWDENLGLVTHNSNQYHQESGGWFDDLMDFVGEVLPIVAIAAVAYFAGPAIVGALGEGAAAGAAAGSVAGEAAVGVAAGEIAAGTAASAGAGAGAAAGATAGAGAAAGATSTSIWATQIGTTTLGNLASNAAVNFGVSVVSNGGDVGAAFRNAGIGMVAGAAGAFAGSAAAGSGALAETAARYGAQAAVQGAASGDMDGALLNGAANVAGVWAGDWAAGQVAEQILDGAVLPDWAASAARTGAGAVVSGAIRGDVEGGLTNAALTVAGAALMPDAPVVETGARNELGLTATQMNGIGTVVGDLARGYATGGEAGLAGAAAGLVGEQIVVAFANGATEAAPEADASGAGLASDEAVGAGVEAGDVPGKPGEDPLRDFMVERRLIDPDTGKFNENWRSSTRTMQEILEERGIPSVTEGDKTHFFQTDRSGTIVAGEGNTVIRRMNYLDGDTVVTVDAGADGRFAIPEGARAVPVTELWRGDTLLGRDFGAPAEWTAAMGPAAERFGGVGTAILGIGGDPAESLRRQVSVNAVLHPELAAMVDKGSGQVNPLLWDRFKQAAAERGIDMVVMTNGLDNSYQEGRNNALIIGNNRDVVAINVYNPTTGSRYFGDGLFEAVPAMMLNRLQTVQVAVANEMSGALDYQSKLEQAYGLKPGSTNAIFIGHSQGTINGAHGLSMLSDAQRERIDAFYIGTAMAWVPETGRITNITDTRDSVTAWASNDHAIERNERFQAGMVRDPANPDNPLLGTRRSIITNIAVNETSPADPINHHSFYLYLQQPWVREALGIVGNVLPSRPFLQGSELPPPPQSMVDPHPGP